MKKIYILLLFLFTIGFAFAQVDKPELDNTKQQNIEALKIAFISRQVKLTPTEAQQFWPVYNEYSNQVHIVAKNDHDVIERDQNILNIRKNYRDQFIKIIGPERTNHLFESEGKFRQLLIQAMQRRQQNKQNQGRQGFDQ